MIATSHRSVANFAQAVQALNQIQVNIVSKVSSKHELERS